MHGDLLDIVLLVACVFFGISGFRQGFLVGLLSFVGILGGGYLGTRLAPSAVRALGSHLSTPVTGILVVFLLASFGQLLAATIGGALRRRLTFRPLRAVDDVGGGVLSILSVLLVAWLLATAVAHSTLTGLARQARRSVIIAAVDHAVPDQVRNGLAAFRRLIDTTGFPAVVGPLANVPTAPVAPPDPAVLNSPAVRNARAAIVKITGDAPSCSRRIEGSGFVIGPQRVLTNAHVVAGVGSPQVAVGGSNLAATVVLYDPNRDIAVLAVPGLRTGALRFSGPASSGSSAVVAGYPQDGPFNAVAARIRQRQDINGPNIYDTRSVTRQVYAIRATVLPGNSGGPLLAPDGTVYGVIFAASTDTADTGYALTATEVASDVAGGRGATAAVSTGGCD
ncbi:MAG TPA: MarP family serine protease [Mycobacteriales bacterium]|nr:MarP family serine protease [Mycobacteriales bacterium]